MKTGYIQVFSNQSATFNHPNDYETKCKIDAFKFVNVPEWITDSLMYKNLEKQGKIKLIRDRKDVAEIEINGKITNTEISNAINNTPENSVEEIDYTHMKSSELYKLCIEKGLEAEPKRAAEYYINILKNNK